MSNSKAIEDWTAVDVRTWLNEQEGYSEEGAMFEDAEISGVALKMLDRTCLKEMGIKSLGKQLQILSRVKDLMGNQNTVIETSSHPSNPNCTPNSLTMASGKVKSKITLKDKQEMSPEQRRLYNEKVKIIRSECLKRWPGNLKVYFKGNERNTLILSELVMLLEPETAIEDIGFGKSAIRSHILQWAVEKNRRIADGYNFEVHLPPAKRARKGDISSSDDCYTDAEIPETNGDNSSSDLNEMSPYSSQLLLAVFLKAPRFRALSYKRDLCSVARKLNVKARGLGKYELANKVAKALIEKGFVSVSNKANVKCLKRDQITVLKTLGEPDVRDVPAKDVHVAGDVAVAYDISTNAESDSSESESDD